MTDKTHFRTHALSHSQGTDFVPILTYHGLSKEKDTVSNGLYTLSEEQFQAQMAAFAEQGFHPVSLEGLLAWFEGAPLPGKPVVITFDDGLESDFSIAFPVLKRHRFPATFFVNPGTLNQKGYLTEEKVQQLHAEGMEIGSHGFDHLFLTRLDTRPLRHQVVDSKKSLETLLGESVSFFSIPRGRYNRKILEMAKEAGYRAVCTSDIGLNPRPSDPFRLRRWAMKRFYGLEEFISVVEGQPDRHLVLADRVRRTAYGVLGHTLYEAIRCRLLREREEG